MKVFPGKENQWESQKIPTPFGAGADMDVMIALFRDAFQRPGGEMGPWMRGWGYPMGFFSIILMFLFWIAVIVAILFLIRWLVVSTRRYKDRRAGATDSALEILKIRYAKGEITKEEFEEKKRDLQT
jgi:putative membrane protein